MSTPLRWHADTDAYRWAEENGFLISNQEIAVMRWPDGLSIYDALRSNPNVEIRRLVGPAYRAHYVDDIKTGERRVERRTLDGPAYLAVFPDGSTIYDHPGSFSVGWSMARTAEEAETELRQDLAEIEARNARLGA